MRVFLRGHGRTKNVLYRGFCFVFECCVLCTLPGAMERLPTYIYKLQHVRALYLVFFVLMSDGSVVFWFAAFSILLVGGLVDFGPAAPVDRLVIDWFDWLQLLIS